MCERGVREAQGTGFGPFQAAREDVECGLQFLLEGAFGALVCRCPEGVPQRWCALRDPSPVPTYLEEIERLATYVRVYELGSPSLYGEF